MPTEAIKIFANHHAHNIKHTIHTPNCVNIDEYAEQIDINSEIENHDDTSAMMLFNRTINSIHT